MAEHVTRGTTDYRARETPVVARPVDETTVVVSHRDAVRWGPIWAGFLGALTAFIVMSVLAVAIGASLFDPGAEAPVTASTVTTALIGIVAFLIGGAVAGWTAATRNAAYAAINGLMVWALFLFVAMLFTALGLGAFFGPVGAVLEQFRIIGALPNVDPNQALNALARTAWIALATLGLTAAAAAIGGVIGRQGRDTDAVTDQD